MRRLISCCNFCILCTAILLNVPCATAVEKGPLMWKIRDLARAPVEVAELRDQRGRLIKKLEVQQLVHVYAVMTGIQEVAEINAELYIVEGDDPNAFATTGENGENIIAIDFGMLELFGDDMHSAAAIIGHELAHLKLNHGKETEEVQKKLPNAQITAANTKYSRDNEREADYLGIIWAIEAGYDPYGAVRVHETLFKLSKRRAGMFVGSHPSSIERITVLKSLARRLSK